MDDGTLHNGEEEKLEYKLWCNKWVAQVQLAAKPVELAAHNLRNSIALQKKAEVQGEEPTGSHIQRKSSRLLSRNHSSEDLKGASRGGKERAQEKGKTSSDSESALMRRRQTPRILQQGMLRPRLQ